MKFIVCSLLLCSTVCVLGKSTNKVRDGRWFRYTYTETKVQKEIVTSLVPSSCVHVEPTLPPCRGVRNLDPFPEFVGSRIYPEHIKGKQLIISKDQQVVLEPANEANKSVGWAEYLGIVAPTVTVTAINLRTTTLLDPRTVVTFSVKGCRPSRLPLGLDRCPVAHSGISIEEIFPSAVVPIQVVPTATRRNDNIIQFQDVNDGNIKKSKNIEIEPSSPGDLSDVDLSSVPTEELS
ncbi:hypothetical protein ILUMI_12447 [Ignelater luminosus]|uniref:Uncharacterized protein n=1 Tax=Ignelater luminosus TaxID=2038154 RepID=A0A8K0CYF7_IGNLU|nr:hypothetical protein ILUMI_12447 [Ignelater luminosus]